MEKNIIKELNKYFDTGINSEEEKLPDIKLTEEEISLYDLVKYVEKEFTELLSLETERLLTSMQDYCNKISIKKLFVPNDGKIKDCSYINFDCSDHKPTIKFYTNNDNYNPIIKLSESEIDLIYNIKDLNMKVRRLYKYLDYLPVNSKEDLYCIRTHTEKLKEIFINISKFKNIINQLKYSNNLFDIYIYHDNKINKLECIIFLETQITEKIMTLGENYSHNFIQLQNIDKDINLNVKNILKKIPIRIPELSYEVQDIIHRQTIGERLETTKQKPLIRKRTKKVG